MPGETGTDITRAARLIREGGLVAFPTETVYGLGTDALDENAVARVFEAKNRPTFDPLIVHVYDVAQLADLVTEIPQAAQKLIERFWPGPLTLVLPKTERVPDLVTAGLPTVGVRIPDHSLALELLREADVPVAAPSANRFGCISPTTAEHVAEQLGETVDYILDGGPCRVGVESTVLRVSVSSIPVMLRPGGVSWEDIEAVIGPIKQPAATPEADESAQPSPGMLIRHYAPQTPLEIERSPVFRNSRASERVGLLAFTPHPQAEQFAVVETLSPSGDLVEAAAGFFAALRRLDAADLYRIIATPFPEQGLGRALNDRLQRAATS
ncbi:MAG: L-threonylcarbamoyladenylate synthase [Planctomycetaceae bacterium]